VAVLVCSNAMCDRVDKSLTASCPAGARLVDLCVGFFMEINPVGYIRLDITQFRVTAAERNRSSFLLDRADRPISHVCEYAPAFRTSLLLQPAG
jgi:hypothetical protein